MSIKRDPEADWLEHCIVCDARHTRAEPCRTDYGKTRVSESAKRDELRLLFAGAGPVLKESLYAVAVTALYEDSLERVRAGSKELAEHLAKLEEEYL